MGNRMKMSKAARRCLIGFWAIGSIGVMLACSIGNSKNFLEATRIAIQVQQTFIYYDRATLTHAVAEATLNAQAPVETLDLTSTPTPDQISPSTATPTSAPVTGALDERTLKSARILLFEDMSASGQIRLVMEALDRAGYFYLDVGSAKGWFKSQLSSAQEWDLIIAAAEADRNFGGEYFGYIAERLDQGAAAIIEFRDIDAAPNGMSKPLLDRCGVKFESDWYQPDLRAFFVLQPEHPIFHIPNETNNTFRNAAEFWQGDIGDLVEIKTQSGNPVSDAILLAGTNSRWKNDHGLLVNCIEERLILQLFPSHEIYYDDILALWQNYIYHTLQARFKKVQSPAPTPAITYAPLPTRDGEKLNSQQDPDGFYQCGEALKARLWRTSQYQVDLFEHHAEGIYAILRLELVNPTPYAWQIWNTDYELEGTVHGGPRSYPADKAATGYLFIENGGNLYQDRIEPGETWRTILAFDIDPSGRDWVLVLRPGSKFNEQVCEVRIPVK